MKTIQKIIIFGLILTFIIGSVSTFPSIGGHGGTIYNGNLYKLFSIPKTWMEAKADCEAQGGHLVTITSQEENDFVVSLFSGLDEHVWIGLTDELTEGNWEWITGETYTYYNWDPSTPEPNGGTDENHAEIYSPSFWNDAPGDFDGNYYVCEWDNVEVTFNGHQYQLITTSKTWAEAKADCEARGGHLVTITSQEENDFVNSLRGLDVIWIGFTDELNEGDWEWITGENVIYTSWNSPTEPNDDGGGEDYVEMFDNGLWNDAGPPGTPDYTNHYVCEWKSGEERVTFNGHDYQLINISKKWDEAKADCEARGGHLVTITSQKENDFVSSLIVTDGIWIGFTDELNEGDWQWVTGEDKVYTNWVLDEPNDSEPGEDYVEIYGDGEWNDNGGPADPALVHPYVCEWNEDGTTTTGTTGTTATTTITATSSTSEEEDTSDLPSLTTPSFELVTWIISLFILISITKIVRKSDNDGD